MLKIRFTDSRASAVALEPPGKTIGKGAANDIVIDEDGVSGFHADLRVDGEAVAISPVGTTGGTRVNGVKITGATPLKAGDVVDIAGVELEIFDADEASKTMVLSGAALAENNGRCWALVADSGPEKGDVIPVRHRMGIGRALGCDISILEPALSREHAELLPQGSHLLLRDLDSANGSLVNGEKVAQADLKDKDRLQFGRVCFIVRAP